MTTVQTPPVLNHHGDSSSSYYLPNDELERQRLHAQHEAYMILLHHQPIHAPVPEHPAKVVDIGCGVNADMTKILARKFPTAKVYGVDLSSVEAADVPNNVEFIRGNVRNLIDVEPRLGSETIDYVFSRFLVAGVDDWRTHIETLTKLVKPGGWLEMQEAWAIDFKNMYTGEVISKDWEWLNHFPRHHQWPEDDMYGSKAFQHLFEECGLQEIDTKHHKLRFEQVPIPEEPEAEAYALYATQMLWQAWAPVFERWYPGPEDAEKRDSLINQVKESFKPEKGKFMPITAVWGRKSAT